MIARTTIDPRLLAPWLSERMPQAANLSIEDVEEPGQGYSSSTLFFTARWEENGQPRSRALVARVQGNNPNPLLRDVFHQYRVIEAAAAHCDAPLPPILMGEESDRLGAPMFLMDRLHGRVPPDFPSYHTCGWFSELSPAQRAVSWDESIRQMHRLHQADWTAFPFLMRGETEAPTARFYLDHFLRDWFEWARDGQSFPEIEDAFSFLVENEPPPSRAGLIWNDARYGNVMYGDDLSVVSLMDFEAATLGPPELDLAHWLYLDEFFATNFGHARISGLPGRDTALAGFEQLYGWKMPYFAWYEAAVALKLAVLSMRDYMNGKVELPERLSPFLMGSLRERIADYKVWLAVR